MTDPRLFTALLRGPAYATDHGLQPNENKIGRQPQPPGSPEGPSRLCRKHPDYAVTVRLGLDPQSP